MNQTNLFEKYELSKAIQTGFVHALPFAPLELVASPDDGYTGPVLVIGYDFYQDNRVFKHAPRTKNFAAHVTATLLRGRGEAPVRLTWGATCFVEDFDGKNIIPINSHLAHEAATFEGLDSISFSPFKLLHPCIRRSYAGTLNDESWRYFDNCMSIQLTGQQFKDAAAAIEKWKNTKKHYQVMGLTNPNCQKFVKHIIREAKIPTPGWLAITPWPGIDARVLEHIARKKRSHGPWLLQSSVQTQRMAEALSPLRDARGDDFYAEPAKAVYAAG